MSNRMNMHSDDESPVKVALRLSIPVGLVYGPLGVGFGLVCLSAGFAWFWAPLMSLFVYGGTVQFVAVSLLMNHASPMTILITATSLAARNSFYGVNFLNRFKMTFIQKMYFVQSLVDANYAIMSIHQFSCPVRDRRFSLWLAFFIHFGWVFGTLIGAVLGKQLTHMPPMIFILIAFLFVIVLEQYRLNRSLKPYLFAGVSLLVAHVVLPNNFVIVGIGLSCILLMLDSRYSARRQMS